MKMPNHSFIESKNIRPIFPGAEGASAILSINSRDHVIGFSTFGLILALWIFVMLFI